MADENIDAVARWLKAHAGCSFAARFAASKGDAQQRLGYSAIHAAVVDHQVRGDIDGFLDGCGAREQAAVLVFPSIKSTDGVVSLARSLNGGRWTCQERFDEARGHLFELAWMAACGLPSSVMGLAPLLSMPMTRRAPLVVLALWPGPPRPTSKGKGLSFMDMPSGLDAALHAEQLFRSTEMTERALGESPKTAPWRRVTFCIELAHSDRLHL